MTVSNPSPFVPIALGKDGPNKLAIQWQDGHCSIYLWTYLRTQCPCATCREEKLAPPDPFRILKPNELTPLYPVAMEPIGHYAYKIVWSDGHDAGIYTLENLRGLCQCPQCRLPGSADATLPGAANGSAPV
jgi:DUF971 family protein